MKRIVIYIYLIYGLIAINPCILLAQYTGSGADGYALVYNVAFCTPASAPTPCNMTVLGGGGDGYGLVDNLTCAPATAPTPYNIPVMGGSGDGYDMADNLSFCTSSSAPSPYNIPVLGGSGNGYELVSNLTLCTVTEVPQTLYIPNQFDIAPNPAGSYLTFHAVSTYTNEAVTVSVMNMLGERIMEEKIVLHDYNVISTINLPAGLYFIKVENESNSSALPLVGKFVKE